MEFLIISTGVTPAVQTSVCVPIFLFEDLETANGYKKYFTVESHDDPFCSQEEFEFWVLEKEAVMPNGFFHDTEQDIEDISLVDWLKREGIMEVPEDLDHGVSED